MKTKHTPERKQWHWTYDLNANPKTLRDNDAYPILQAMDSDVGPFISISETKQAMIAKAPEMLELIKNCQLFINNLYRHFQGGGQAKHGGSIHNQLKSFLDHNDFNALLAGLEE